MEESNLKIGTWNLCLGLSNKKDIVTKYLKMNDIAICCLQETEVQSNFPTDILNLNDYVLEPENCIDKRRAGIYCRTNVNYTRRRDLELNDCHIVVIDVVHSVNLRIINVYRSFRPPDGTSASAFFLKQLNVIKNALCKNCYVMGDFNLYGGINIRPDYSNKFTIVKV